MSMKKLLVSLFVIIMMAVMLSCVPMAALAEGGAVQGIDWTPIVVAVIGTIGTAMSTLLARVWMKYVKPWLEQRGLNDAAVIVVYAAEALFGRYCGTDKWKYALDQMADRGFYTDNQQVIDALKAAWEKLNIAQVTAGIKEAVPIPASGGTDKVSF